MSAREFPEWMYSVPDARTAHIRELEAALLESNNGAARLAEIVQMLMLQIKLMRTGEAAA